MKFYTKAKTNYVFTIKNGSSTNGLILVGDISKVRNCLLEKGLSWVNKIDSKFATVLVNAFDLDDKRIKSYIDIVPIHNLSADCHECITI